MGSAWSRDILQHLSETFRGYARRRELESNKAALTRYRFLPEAPPTAPAAPAAPAPAGARGPILVESGAFRVDREKAIEKLAGYQLPDPTAFLVPWLRCAESSGASFVDVVRTGDLLEMRFDGRPLARRVVQDPVSALFDEEGEDSERGRHLAAGLVAALRLGPASLSVISGHGPERSRTDIAPRDAPAPPRPPDVGLDTVLGVRLPRLGANLCAQALREAFGLSRLRLTVLGRQAPDRPAQAFPVHEFREGTLSGLLMLTGPGPGPSEVRFYKQGALVTTLDLRPGVLRVRAWLRDDSFRLDLSQSSVARDARYERAMDALSRETEEYLKLLGKEHAVRWPGLTRCIVGDPVRTFLWRLYLERPALGAVLLGRPAARAAVPALVRWDAGVTQRLREALALRGSFRSAEWNHPLWRVLMEVPVFLTADGTPISCRSIFDWQGSTRRVPVLDGLRTGRFWAIWCPRKADREFLETLFPPDT